MRVRHLPPAGLLAILALAYFAVGRVSLALDRSHGVVTPVWPAAGVALAFLILFGARLWPAVAVPALLVALSAGMPAWAAALIAAGSAGAALAGVGICRRLGGLEPSLRRTRDVLALLAAAVISAPIAAAAATAVLVRSGALTGIADVRSRFLTLWFGDASSILLVAPAILTWTVPRAVPRGPRPRVPEVIAFAAAVGLAGLLVFGTPFPYSYPLFPLLVYAAMRFGPRGIATTLAVTAGGLAAAGGFPAEPSAGNGIHLLISVSLAGCTALLLAAEAAGRASAADNDLKSLNLLQMVFGAIDAVFVKDREGRYLMANPATESVGGQPPGTMVGKTDHELFEPRESFRIVAADHAVMATGEARTLEEQLRVGDQTRYFLTTKAPYRDASGAIAGVIGIARDISELKRAEDRLRHSEERFRTLIESAPDYICSLDREGRFEFINRTARGFDASLLMGSSVYEHVVAEDRSRVREAIESVFRTGRSVDYENRGQGDDRGLAWFRCTAGPIMEGGKVKSVMVVARDVTTQKQMEDRLRESEERFRSLVENAPDFFAELDAGGRILFINRAGQNREDLVGRVAYDFVPAADRERARAEVDGILRGGIPGTVEVEWALAGREIRRYRCRVGPLLGHGPPRALVIASDITEATRAEQELRFSRERLQHLSRRLIDIQETERRHIARELHDEIGQALTAVKMSLQAGRRRAGAAGEGIPDESMAIVDEALERVRNLSVALRPSLLDDLGLVPALRWYLDQQAGRAGFRCQFEADLDIEAPADVQTACFRIAQEALTNVARHSRAERVMLEVKNQEGELHLTVSDDGLGFDVLDAFARTGGDASLGLLGMRERARLLGGRVTVQSEPARGTVIHARFPLDVAS